MCVKRSVAEPRYAWGGETHHSVGRISEIESDGLLIIDLPDRPIPWQADPSDMEKVDDFKVNFFSPCVFTSLFDYAVLSPPLMGFYFLNAIIFHRSVTGSG